MRLPTIRFRRVWPARSYGFRTLPVTLEPVGDVGARGPFQLGGGGGISRRASLRPLGGESIAPGRSFLGQTQDDLNSGPPPDRIDHGRHANDRGITSVTDGTGTAYFPYDGAWMFIKHNPIPRTPITVTPFARTIDTGVTIPSIGIGNPV